MYPLGQKELAITRRQRLEPGPVLLVDAAEIKLLGSKLPHLF